MNTLICVTALVVVAQVPADYRDRERHPLAPSLPRLTKDEEKKIDATIERLILADIGKIRGDDAKKANDDFNRLGPEAIFNLIDGLNRAANMESSCPAVLIAKKVARVVTTTDDMELLAFAKENIGAGVSAKRHLNVLKDLQSMILLRQGALRRTALVKGTAKTPGSMSLAELEKGITKESGAKLKTMLTEAEKRQGPKAVDLLLMGIASSDAEIAKLSQGLLAKNLQHQSGDALKALLKHDRKEVRIGAAQAIGAKKLRFGAELIGLLQDGDDDVRQASRAALTQISGGVDHGPEPDASFGARESAVARWRDWWGRQK
jgi:HEAT repeat protein